MQDVTTASSALAWFRAHAWVRWPLALGLLVLWWTSLVHQGPWFELLGRHWHAVRWSFVVPSALFMALLAGRHRSLLGAMVLLSPAAMMPARFVANAAVAYSQGEAEYLSGGLPSVVHHYHPTLHIPMRYTGCMVSDVSELEQTLNNGTLELLVEWLGPMHGSGSNRALAVR